MIDVDPHDAVAQSILATLRHQEKELAHLRAMVMIGWKLLTIASHYPDLTKLMLDAVQEWCLLAREGDA